MDFLFKENDLENQGETWNFLRPSLSLLVNATQAFQTG